MYTDTPITGASLPAKTLCLTFDDGPGETPGLGPGPHTLKLAEYLGDQGVPATFFMVGKFAEQFSRLLPNIQALGHLIANHTFSHPNLVDFLNAGGNVIDQVARTDVLIRNWVDSETIFVRPPYGAWSTELTRILNDCLEVSLSHVGPVNWVANLDAGDWAYWQDDRSPQDCADDYLARIEATGHGIVLMHDSSADRDVVKQKNMTCEMIQILVPALLDLEYQFVRLDQVPEVQAAVNVSPRHALLASNGQYISPQQGGGGDILVNGPAIGAWEPLRIDYLAPGKVTLRAPNGLYVSPQDGGGANVLADGSGVGAWEPLDLISVGTDKVAFRTTSHHFLTRETALGGRLTATAERIADWEVFSVRTVI